MQRSDKEKPIDVPAVRGKVDPPGIQPEEDEKELALPQRQDVAQRTIKNEPGGDVRDQSDMGKPKSRDVSPPG